MSRILGKVPHNICILGIGKTLEKIYLSSYIDHNLNCYSHLILVPLTYEVRVLNIRNVKVLIILFSFGEVGG